MTSKAQSQSQLNLPTFAVPSSPQSPRKLRKFQSHQALSSTFASSSVSHQRPQPQQASAGLRGPVDEPASTSQNVQADSAARSRPTRRPRSNSDAGASNLTPLTSQKRPARKTGSSGYSIKRSSLESLLREGPPNGSKILDGLQELRYLVLSTRVDADSDGMVKSYLSPSSFPLPLKPCLSRFASLLYGVDENADQEQSSYRIYLWLALLDIPPLPTDEYLSLVHRGPSPAYTKIRNDTFRTLATDPLFKRRVTEASLIRLLNAVAWRLHDSKNGTTGSRPSSRKRELELSIDNPPTIEEEPSLEMVEATNSAIPAMNKPEIYVQGMNVLCAPFLYAARSEVEAFALFHYFITRECPSYIRGAMVGVHKGLNLVDRCLEIVEPKLANYLFSKGMHAKLYAFPSVLTLCACTPPLPEVLHLWDFLFAYGPHLNILCIVAQLIRMRDAILESPSPTKVLRSFLPLNAKDIIALTVMLVKMIPIELYEELVDHTK
ncbi:hypothetical protein Egran_02740 [Elaphomyces granulatus]|uniref:Rab-GAP TBC domain-containing protein n=1 Tax=Elaphomyces granulatus TaxID=519963 RepID=A0A232LZB5_9EURO|nr:hypothetical protein Egran_02740 [Elaphomyces granulatus]